MGKKTFAFFSFLLLSAASIYCLFLVCEFVLNPNVSNAPLYSQKAPDNPAEITSAKEDELSSEDKTNSLVTSNTKNSSLGSEITAASKGKAKGKIVTRFIDSSSANLSYKKVYIKNGTSLNIDIKTSLLNPPKLKIQNTSSPQVLIVHTHTTECYMTEERDYYTDADQTRTTNNSKNIVAVGEILKKTLEKGGIGVVHATEKHDYPEYTGSYNRAADTINKYLKKYPTIKVVIDLHRDSVTSSDGTKSALVKEVEGKKAAQVMLVSGCQSKTVTGFENWKENFRLAVRLQQTMEVMYPGLARPILFTPRRYNQHLTTGSLLIECGTEANTLEQAKYSAELLGKSLVSTLNMLKE
ncbi:MAG: stage II sporulation protein P [Acutalibacteraceae bacterium]|nr:stage II sporulation protein P [Acutalibacteraceae bacterium]